jgi:nucleoside-diphosphate-sugar epimerase
MRLLVTGASGFVGSHVLPALADVFPAAEIIGCGDAPGMEKLDITEAQAVQALVGRIRPAGIVHLAAIAAPAAARRDPSHAWAVNHAGTLALANALAASVPSGAFVFASSAEVYGRSFDGTALDETAPLAPLNPYAATKAAADLALGAIPGIAAVRLRPFNHTGPRQSAGFVVPAFARQIARIEAGLQKPAMTVGRLDTARDFLDVRDVACAYALALRHALAGGAGAFNIASGTARNIGDVLDRLLALSGIAARVESEPARAQPEIVTARGEAAAARGALGWHTTIPWETTLADVLADWRTRVRGAG